jgi:hypothetical protein
MTQFYFLSIVFNILVGLVLLSEYLGDKFEFFAPFKNILLKTGPRTVIGIVSVLVGIFKLIVMSPGETVVVAGDLLPAITGIGIGGIVLFDFLRQKMKLSNSSVDAAMNAVTTYHIPLGVLAIVVAIIHFLVPGVVIL